MFVRAAKRFMNSKWCDGFWLLYQILLKRIALISIKFPPLSLFFLFFHQIGVEISFYNIQITNDK